MDFLFHARPPRGPLSRYVATLWYASGQIPYRRESLLPTGNVDLIINLGSPFLVGGRRVVDGWTRGLQTRPSENEPLAETHVVGVSFRDHGALPFLGVPVAELSDEVVSIEELWGRQIAAGLRERLWEERGAESKLAVLEAYLSRRLPDGDSRTARVEHALARLRSAPVAVSTLCRELEISPKHLISEFRRVVGAPPKAVARLQRFNRLLGAIDARQPMEWAELAYAQGYSDQAHMIHEFREFSGVTPTEYVRRRTEVFGPLAPGQDVHFLPGG